MILSRLNSFGNIHTVGWPLIILDFGSLRAIICLTNRAFPDPYFYIHQKDFAPGVLSKKYPSTDKPYWLATITANSVSTSRVLAFDPSVKALENLVRIEVSALDAVCKLSAHFNFHADGLQDSLSFLESFRGSEIIKKRAKTVNLPDSSIFFLIKQY